VPVFELGIVGSKSNIVPKVCYFVTISEKTGGMPSKFSGGQ